MATLTVQPAPARGLLNLSSLVAADAGLTDKFTNDGTQLIAVKNGDNASHTLTLVIQSTVDGQAPANKVLTLAAGATYIVGPFPTATYNDANGQVSLVWSAVTSVTVMPFKVA